MKKDINWFINRFSSKLSKYDVKISSLKEEDEVVKNFGDMDRIEFEDENKGGCIDFWSQGFIDISFVDYNSERILFNKFIEPIDNSTEIFDELENLM